MAVRRGTQWKIKQNKGKPNRQLSRTNGIEAELNQALADRQIAEGYVIVIISN